MTAKSKSQSQSVAKSRTFLVVSVIVVPIVVAFLASPLLPALVNYFKKAPPVENPSPTVATAVPSKDASSASHGTSERVEEDCLAKAWEAFNATKYESAIAFAERCIDNFGKTAEREQQKLDDENAPLPPTGKVSVAQKKKILEQGLLNDVATAFYVKGRSAEYLYQKGGPTAAANKTIAEEAYEATCKFKRGRTWDTRGWFWSPCQVATERLPVK